MNRRGFIRRALALLLGGIAALVPVSVAVRVLTDPLRRKSSANGLIRVASLDSLPADGVPRKFPVLASKTDAWNKFANAPVGAVYLRRTEKDGVKALNVVCPHAGCFVDYAAEQDQFICPCHKSSFKADGAIANPGSPSPRGLDSLTVEVRDDGGVWVQFQNFQAGRPDKVPVS
jgi:menaquinol-cytochrome c reductase iron-sulfur subunit